MVRGRVNIFVRVIIMFIALITVLAAFLVRQSVGGTVGAIVGPVISLKERAPVYVSDVKAPGIAVRKTMHAVDDVL